jgi:hypothetical protein
MNFSPRSQMWPSCALSLTLSRPSINRSTHLYTVQYFMADSPYTVSNISRISRPLLPSFTRNLILVLCSVITQHSILTAQKNVFTNTGTEKYIRTRWWPNLQWWLVKLSPRRLTAIEVLPHLQKKFSARTFCPHHVYHHKSHSEFRNILSATHSLALLQCVFYKYYVSGYYPLSCLYFKT